EPGADGDAQDLAVVIEHAHIGHLEFSDFNGDPGYFEVKLLLVPDPHYGRVDSGQHRVQPAQPVDPQLLFNAYGDVAHDGGIRAAAALCSLGNADVGKEQRAILAAPLQTVAAGHGPGSVRSLTESADEGP